MKKEAFSGESQARNKYTFFQNTSKRRASISKVCSDKLVLCSSIYAVMDDSIICIQYQGTLTNFRLRGKILRYLKYSKELE